MEGLEKSKSTRNGDWRETQEEPEKVGVKLRTKGVRRDGEG